MSAPPIPALLHTFGGVWENGFWDDFTRPSSLTDNYFHPLSDGWRENPANKWKWDAHSNKEIHWDWTCTEVVSDGEGSRLRVCVWSDWFHRIDRVATKELFGYGYFEARLRFKGAEGMHAAFWLLPDSIDDSRIYPQGDIPGGIEVDVVEHRANDGQRKPIAHIGSTATHWSGYGPNHQSAAYSEISLPKPASEWSSFGILHDETGIKWFWDGKQVNQTIVRSSKPMHIYFSTEVNESGGWAGINPFSYGPLHDPAGFIEVDSVGYWKKVHDASAADPSIIQRVSDKRFVASLVKEAKSFFPSH